MQARTIAGIILYAAAIAAPTAWLYVHHGLSAPVDTGSIDDLVTLAGTAVVAFVLGLIASKVSQPSTISPLEALRDILNGIQQDRGRGRGPRGADRGREMPTSK